MISETSSPSGGGALPAQAMSALHKALNLRTSKAGGPKAFRECIDVVAQLCCGKPAHPTPPRACTAFLF